MEQAQDIQYNLAFLDSGTGGLPYMTYLKQKKTDIACIYVADTANFPYGEKNPQDIIDCASKTTAHIVHKYNPQAIVLACNTISVYALDALREQFPATHFIGTVPAIKQAAKISLKRKIGLLATKATCNAPYTNKLIAEFASDCTVIRRSDSDLITFIERRLLDADESEKYKAISPAISQFVAADIDTLILGCTHFIHVAHELHMALKKESCDVHIIDSREGVVSHALTILAEHSTAITANTYIPDLLYITSKTANVTEYKNIASRFSMDWKGTLVK